MVSRCWCHSHRHHALWTRLSLRLGRSQVLIRQEDDRGVAVRSWIRLADLLFRCRKEWHSCPKTIFQKISMRSTRLMDHILQSLLRRRKFWKEERTTQRWSQPLFQHILSSMVCPTSSPHLPQLVAPPLGWSQWSRTRRRNQGVVTSVNVGVVVVCKAQTVIHCSVLNVLAYHMILMA